MLGKWRKGMSESESLKKMRKRKVLQNMFFTTRQGYSKLVKLIICEIALR